MPFLSRQACNEFQKLEVWRRRCKSEPSKRDRGAVGWWCHGVSMMTGNGEVEMVSPFTYDKLQVLRVTLTHKERPSAQGAQFHHQIGQRKCQCAAGEDGYTSTTVALNLMCPLSPAKITQSLFSIRFRFQSFLCSRSRIPTSSQLSPKIY